MRRFEQITNIEELEEIAQKEKAEETLKAIAKKHKQIERKLYQKPPLANEYGLEESIKKSLALLFNLLM